MATNEDITVKYIMEHKARVKQWIEVFIRELRKRAELHDDSKLEEPEISGWRAMDKEPRYKYGTKEYFDKVNRYKWLIEQHWKSNRHHPEYWTLNPDKQNRDLIDIIEMLSDWLGYSSKKPSYNEAKKLVEEQTKRYGLDKIEDTDKNPPLYTLILNTLTNNYVSLGGIERPDKDTSSKDKYKINSKVETGKTIDIYV